MGKPVDFVMVDVKDGEEEDGEVTAGGEKGGSKEGNEEDKGGGEAKEKAAAKKAGKKKTKKQVKEKQRNPFFLGVDPRIDLDEDYHIHTNFALVQRLVELLSRHYPDRLAQALVVPSGGWIKTVGTFGLRAYVPDARTRAKVTMLHDLRGLLKFVKSDDLVAFAGGKALVAPKAFEC
eukprot:CAMPEP_0113558908 /NCGR_PEP_ID=MMETSP0015_2-20120614/18608_1 /TAXON_ID=2838 /ORGANISM="Odontella" /LENGTH=176 /DNA_ID=CAMNT_0000460497 /DNA_START=1 /DNA_END=531 /DNA_ORIENTATION=+ /assembly_acc=CAM_ASM_000160